MLLQRKLQSGQRLSYFSISRGTRHSSFHLCFDRRLLPLPRSKPSIRLLLLLILAGDVSTNPGPGRPNVKIATVNARSLKLKTAAITDLISSHSIDILALTETWIKPSDTVACVADLTPPGFCFKHRPRAVRRGGGVGFMVSDVYQTEEVPLPTYSTFESFSLKITAKAFSGIFLCIYHPEPYHKTLFFEQFQDLLEHLAPLPNEIFIMGDLNLHLDTASQGTIKFNDILNMLNLKQHVNFATHICGH